MPTYPDGSPDIVGDSVMGQPDGDGGFESADERREIVDPLSTIAARAVFDDIDGGWSLEECRQTGDAVLKALRAAGFDIIGGREAHYRGVDWEGYGRDPFCGNCMAPWPCPASVSGRHSAGGES